MPRQPCREPGCRALVDRGYCEQHRGQSAARYDRRRRADPRASATLHAGNATAPGSSVATRSVATHSVSTATGWRRPCRFTTWNHCAASRTWRSPRPTRRRCVPRVTAGSKPWNERDRTHGICSRRGVSGCIQCDRDNSTEVLEGITGDGVGGYISTGVSFHTVPPGALEFA